MVKRSSKPKKGIWFHRVRGSYLPVSWQGWLTYIPFTIFLLWVLIWAVDTETSTTQAILIIFPAWIAGAVVMTWLAANKS